MIGKILTFIGLKEAPKTTGTVLLTQAGMKYGKYAKYVAPAAVVGAAAYFGHSKLTGDKNS